jgi:hypothetical protein
VKALGSTQIPSNAMLSMYKLPNGMTFADADRIVNSHTQIAKLIFSCQDGDSWKSYLLVTYQGKQQLIILYRIGINDGYGVEAMVCFPHLAQKGKESLKVLTLYSPVVNQEQMLGVLCNPDGVTEMVNQFNDFCSTLKIGAKNSVFVKAALVDPPSNAKYFRKTEEQSN